MRHIFFLIGILMGSLVIAQTTVEIENDIISYQNSENEKFLDAETTQLTTEDFVEFKKLDFYPINLDYRVVATFVRTPDESPFLMKTTTDRLPEYVKYGEAHFELFGKRLSLILFKSTNAWGNPEKYGNHLFLPFTDLTSGDGSYAGGRFIDLIIPDGDTIVIDFNKSYNPYCAYNPKYSCPIPPRENDLLVRIEAGIKDFGKH